MDSTNQTNQEHSKTKIIQEPGQSHFLPPDKSSNISPAQPNQPKEQDPQSDMENDDQQFEQPVRDLSQESEKKSFSDFDVDSESSEDLKQNEAPIDDAEKFEQENIRLQLLEEDEKYGDKDEEPQETQKEKYYKPKGEKMKISLRNFQATLIQNSRDRNSIIYLPTGTGKTRISICSMYYYLCKYGTSKKIVFLANTIQLVKQQAEAIKQTLSAIISNQAFAKDLRQKLGGNYIQLGWKVQDLNNHVICVHGQRNQDQTITKRKRIQAYMTTRKQFLNQMKKATVTVMISQMFINCLRRGYLKLTDYSFMVFDQCHHCDGDHPYAGIMKEFYFEQKRKIKADQEANRVRDQDRLPIIMGLTASPVLQPYNNHNKLSKQLQNLCVNLDSNFSYYPFGDEIVNNTQILIQQIIQPPESQREPVPDLIEHFDRYKDHAISLSKIKIHFPCYYECVKQVISMMSKAHEDLKVQVQGSKIVDPELYLFYDLKECLLLKLRDLWLQLGQFAFSLGFHQMCIELNRLTGLRNQSNTHLLQRIKVILKYYDLQFKNKFGYCKKQFMSTKLIKLIEILKPQNEETINQSRVSDMVLVFAFKRRTVKYLQMVLQKYKDQLHDNEKKFYRSVGVTGYASRQKIYRSQDGHSIQSNPSAEEDQATINKYYNLFMDNQREHLRNKITLQSSMIGDNKVLNNEMDRMYHSKMGKMLLEVQEKYSNQIKKIVEFKKKYHRVLITTSVTQEGFDIPGCNLVISFDTPFSMKSYIQIKGRARKKNSKYIIFTNQKSYKWMSQQKKIYDNTINAIYQLAIGEIAKKDDIRSLQKISYSPSYEKVKTKGGALLNTNYALQLLKSYFTCLKPPNRPYFHFVETSNICFKCVIKFPESSTCSKAFAIGKPQPRKLQALKSAAFQAVKILKKQGFIRDDLRPSRLEQLEQQMQLQRYDDLGLYSKDTTYKQIMDRYVQVYQDCDPNTKKKVVRFYFKSLQPQKLEFHNINRKFDLKAFQNKEELPFQIYMVKFSNKINKSLYQQKDSIHQIGILTCFQPDQTKQIFARFRQSIQPTSKEYFQLKLVENEVRLNKSEYQYYKVIHNFMLAGQKNMEVDYYNQLNNFPIVLAPQWSNSKAHRKISLKIDQTRRYFPLMVLLKRSKEGKHTNYRIDQNLNEKISKHIQLFKKVYTYHNKPGKFTEKLFEEDLTVPCKNLIETIKGYDIQQKKILVQTFNKEMCFHKGLLSSKIQKYSKDLQKQDENTNKKGKYRTKYQKVKKQFIHFKNDNNIQQEQLVKFVLWKNVGKDDLNEFLNKQAKIKTKIQDASGSFRFLRQFVLYPISYPTMLRISLITKYVFHVFEDFSTALYFRKFYLSQIFEKMTNKLKGKGKDLQHYRFAYYKSVILDHSQKLYIHLQNAGKCKYLRDLGRTLISGQIRANDSNLKFDVSSIQNVQLDQSVRINPINSSNILSNSILDSSKIEQSFPSLISQAKDIGKDIVEDKKEDSKFFKVNLDILKNLKIQDILRALTSKIYKHMKSANYEEYQFIGDVVLKYLTTIQIFLQKTDSQEGQMHIGRANIICNANLHRAAIKKKLFQYIFTTKKRTEVIPLVRQHIKQEKIEQKKKYAATDIQILGEDDDQNGYQYIPGKVHADVLQALIGIFYLKNKNQSEQHKNNNLNECQTLLYAFGILNKPNLQIQFDTTRQKRYQLPEYFKNIEQKLKYKFRHKQLLIQSLTHPTFLTHIQDVIDDNQSSFSKLFNNRSNINNSSILNLSILSDQAQSKQALFKKNQTFYQRMQFLGDAFLDLLVVEYLYDQGGDYLDDEGTLSFLKQSAVSNKTLGFIALELGLQEFMFIDMDQFDTTIKQFRRISKQMDHLPNPLQFSKLKIGSLKILGDVFESLIGAILIDNDFNYQATKKIVMNLIGNYVKHFTSISFIQQCPTYKYKQYLNQNNYKKYKLIKVPQEDIIGGLYLYRLTDRQGNSIGQEVRASNDKDAWDQLLELTK